MNTRLSVVKVLQQVIQHGSNLPDALTRYQDKIAENEKSLAQAMSYGVIRFYPKLEYYLNALMQKPLKEKDTDIKLLLLLGFYQLSEMRIPDHAAVSETVKVTKSLKKPWAKNLVNGVLRNFQRQQDELLTELLDNAEKHQEAVYSHPAWWITRLKNAWPQHWQNILEANNQNPPMTLRLNTRDTAINPYLELLDKQGIEATPGAHSPVAIRLTKALPVTNLPLFQEGKVSVQDEAAQMAALLLAAEAGERVLDACAAPGGKTIHILEHQPEVNLLAIDIDETRLERIRENLTRTGLTADVKAANAFKPDSWWDEKPFDRILLDAPCSASGVIRRHPDIKLLRKDADIAKLVADQQQILAALWPLLKTGGMLLYATCSVFPEENALQVENFLAQTPDAELITFPDKILCNLGEKQETGIQILPGEDGMDGFFYAGIQKISSA